MTPSNPNLVTLLGWAERLARGERCADWEAWSASTTESASQWTKIERALVVLDSGSLIPALDDESSAEDLAVLVDEHLPAGGANRVGHLCNQSVEAIAEVFSAVRFEREPTAVTVSKSLQERLLALHPDSDNCDRSKAVTGQPASDRGRLTPPGRTKPLTHSSRARWLWPLVAAAAVFVVALSGSVGWILGVRRGLSGKAATVAATRVPPKETQQTATTQRAGELRKISPTNSKPPSWAGSSPPAKARESISTVLTPPDTGRQIAVDPRPAPSQQQFLPEVSPRAPSRAMLSRSDLTFHSAKGLMLIEPNGQGKWQVARDRVELYDSVSIVSLAESWTTIDIPRFGTLIWSGFAEGKLGVLADGQVELRLMRGKVAIQNLNADSRVRLETSGATWTARGIDNRSTVAVVDDPQNPILIVSRGRIAAEELKISAGQLIRWEEGVPQVTDVASSSEYASIDLAWLQPPDEKLQRQWNHMFGRLVDKLSASEDARVELNRLLTIAKEPRQAALLAQWNVSLADPAERWQQTWSMLSDRREALRMAGMKSLLEHSPADSLNREMMDLLRRQLGEAMAQHVSQWLVMAQQPGQLPAAQALELAEHLGHSQLAVRQIAVSLLEMHIAPAFQQALFQQPLYDAAAPASRRAGAQAEWQMIIRQLYAPTRRNPAGLFPALKPMQPSVSAQNSAPGVP